MSQPFTISKELGSHQVTASVGFVSPVGQPEQFLAIRNKRGWDIPGGHVESSETPEQSFHREVLEETGCELVTQPLFIAALISHTYSGTAIAVYRAFCELKQFIATPEIAECRVLSRRELLDQYFGDKTSLEELLDLCDTSS